MMKYWRIWILIIMVVSGLLAIGLKPQHTGVQVAYVSGDSPAKGVLEEGMIISEVNGQSISGVSDWDSLVREYQGKIKLKADRKTYGFDVNESGMGVEVTEVDRLNLDFGLDIKGGTRILLEPTENSSAEVVEQVIDTLQIRSNIYGLREIKLIPVSDLSGNHYVQVEAAGLGREIVDTLLSRQGHFEAKVVKPVFLKDNRGTFDLLDNKYDLEYTGDGTVMIGDLTPSINDTFVLDGIDFKFVNVTQNGDELIFLGSAYKGKDIELIYSDAQHSGLIPRSNFFEFYFTILVSEEGANRFAKITSGIPSQLDLNSGDYYLKDSKILLYLDGQLVSDLRIGSTLGGKVYTTPQISGSRETKEEALDEKLNLQTILRSGALPVALETVSVGVISPTLGKGFIVSALYAAGLAALAIVVITFVRYRKIRVTLPLVLTGFSEVVIILGIASNNDWFIWGPALILSSLVMMLAWLRKYETDPTAWFGIFLIPFMGAVYPGAWTIDLPVIGGIIAALGVGVDNMIVIADETLSGKGVKKAVYSIKEKIKRAFFIIFGSAATTIFAMLPLVFLVAGFVRGFATTTIVGVLVGILITRPAYAKMVEVASERERG